MIIPQHDESILGLDLCLFDHVFLCTVVLTCDLRSEIKSMFGYFSCRPYSLPPLAGSLVSEGGVILPIRMGITFLFSSSIFQVCDHDREIVCVMEVSGAPDQRHMLLTTSASSNLSDN